MARNLDSEPKEAVMNETGDYPHVNFNDVVVLENLEPLGDARQEVATSGANAEERIGREQGSIRRDDQSRTAARRAAGTHAATLPLAMQFQ